MHWVIQKNLFKPANYLLLTEALDRSSITYTSVFIPTGTYDLEPALKLDTKVYVCGAIKLKTIAEQRGWLPGSFLNDNFSFDVWVAQLGAFLLNADVRYGTFSEINVDSLQRFFIRPLEDNKAFDGMVIDSEMLTAWRGDATKKYLENLNVIVSPVKEIYREYRIFVVNKEVVTGSVYKVSGQPQLSQQVEQGVIDFVYDVIDKWLPAESVVIDVCLTSDGYRVIEFNNINSSGFYASDVQKYVQAIQKAYG